MATFIRRHPLLAYYVLTFALSWGGFLLVIGPSLTGQHQLAGRSEVPVPRSWSCSPARASRACC